MEKFTILDVVRYNAYLDQEYKPSPNQIIREMTQKFVNRISDESFKKSLRYLSGWMYVSYRYKDTFNKDLIQIPFKIVEGVWKSDECNWFMNTFLDMIIPEKTTCCFIPFTINKLSNPKELFYIFCEILRQKFSYDEYLICIIDNLLKFYIF